MMGKLKVALLVLLFMGVFTACSDDDTPAPAPVVPDVEVEEPVSNEPTAEELAEMAAADKFAAANSVYRALAEIDELPENWESTTYEPSVGYALDEANTDIRALVATDAEEARSYFLSIVPDLGLNGDSWSHEGVGTLTFRAVNEANCYAVLDVNLVQMPGLKQIRFVTQEVLGDNASDRAPYYKAGDILRDSKNRYWICVRPASPERGKKFAYFVTFDKSRITTTTKSQNIYAVDDNGALTRKKIDGLSKDKWTYATNLVEERIATAAGHTFAMFAGSYLDMQGEYLYYMEKGLYLDKANIINFAEFVHQISPNIPLEENTISFSIAYGSYVSNPYPKVRQEKYLQPVMIVAHEKIEGAKPGEKQIQEKIMKHMFDVSNPNVATDYLLSLTQDYDPLSFWKLTDGGFQWSGDDEEGIGVGYNEAFNVMNYVSGYNGKSAHDLPKYVHLKNWQDHNVLLMTQKKITDSGKPDKEYTLLYTRGTDFTIEPDYWQSIENVKRTIFTKQGYVEFEEE